MVSVGRVNVSHSFKIMLVIALNKTIVAVALMSLRQGKRLKQQPFALPLFLVNGSDIHVCRSSAMADRKAGIFCAIL